jgi:hypothetical protein
MLGGTYLVVGWPAPLASPFGEGSNLARMP